jgi:Tfp pilus assembly protein PilF
MFRLGSNSVNNVRLALFLSTALLLSACGSPEDRAQTHYKKGMELLAQNNTVLARVEFRNALQRKKDMVEA